MPQPTTPNVMRFEAEARPAPAQAARGSIAAALAVLMKSRRVNEENGFDPDEGVFMVRLQCLSISGSIQPAAALHWLRGIEWKSMHRKSSTLDLVPIRLRSTIAASIH